ncbi:TPR-like protein, partial [Tuber magnatum]
MIVRLRTLTLAATLFSGRLVACAASHDQPVQSLIESANALLAKGDMHGALDHFEAAIKKDPANYLTIFKRGATYLSLGRSSQASADFDAVLSLKPDFEAALLQRAKLKSRTGDWSAARRDYKKVAGAMGGEKIAELDEAEQATKVAMEAEEKGDYEACVTHAGTAIVVASGLHSLRSLRSRCRLKRGEVHEAVGDLTHLVQLLPGDIDPHLQIANLLYFSVNDYDRSVAQLRKCLHSDPDSKPCSKLFRRIKNLEKSVANVRTLVEKRQYTSATRLLVGHAGETGLINEVREEVANIKKAGYYTSACPKDLLLWLLETACEVYTEV